MNKNQIQQLLKQEGFEYFGAAELKRPIHFPFYQAWVDQGYAAGMEYLRTHLELKESPEKTFAPARYALVVAAPYRQLSKENPLPFTALRVARYARDIDYHFWLKESLSRVINQLQVYYPENFFRAVTDSAPLMERDLAQRAGLGWVGKNTCLINRQIGSYFLIGEILTDMAELLEMFPTDPLALEYDFCGTCQRCIQACPTGALVEPKKLDARLCIAYWTIEAKSPPPLELRDKMGGKNNAWFFGCDICQDVCPWNIKLLNKDKNVGNKTNPQSALSPSREKMISELQWILSASTGELKRRFASTPLSRPGTQGLRRNAILVAVQEGITELIPQIQSHIEAEKRKIASSSLSLTSEKQHQWQAFIDWALEQLQNQTASNSNS